MKTIQIQKITLVKEDSRIYEKQILSSEEMNYTIRNCIEQMKFELNYVEHFFLIGMNNAHKIQIFAHISTGGCTSTIVDTKVIFSHLLLSGCNCFAICHNHPSGEIKPSEADLNLTKKIKDGASILDLRLLDHIVLSGTDKKYYSFADEVKI